MPLTSRAVAYPGWGASRSQRRRGATVRKRTAQRGAAVLLSRVARPLLAAVSVANGVETLMNPKPKIEAVTPLLAKGQGVLPAPVSPALVVQAGAATKIAAGLMMGLG